MVLRTFMSMFMSCCCDFHVRMKEHLGIDLPSGEMSASAVLSLIMKLKRLCNHPNLVEPCTSASTPLLMDSIAFSLPSLVDGALNHDPLKVTHFVALLLVGIVCLLVHL